MDKSKVKQASLARRQRRVRAKIKGNATRPRLRVSRSNRHISAQVIDDVARVTLASAASNEAEIAKAIKGSTSNAAAAKVVGEIIGKRTADAGISEVTFDRGGHLYHGRVQALADGARSAGLKF